MGSDKGCSGQRQPKPRLQRCRPAAGRWPLALVCLLASCLPPLRPQASARPAVCRWDPRRRASGLASSRDARRREACTGEKPRAAERTSCDATRPKHNARRHHSEPCLRRRAAPLHALHPARRCKGAAGCWGLFRAYITRQYGWPSHPPRSHHSDWAAGRCSVPAIACVSLFSCASCLGNGGARRPRSAFSSKPLGDLALVPACRRPLRLQHLDMNAAVNRRCCVSGFAAARRCEEPVQAAKKLLMSHVACGRMS